MADEALPLSSERLSTRARWAVEVLVVLCLAVLPDLANAVVGGSAGTRSFTSLQANVGLLTRSAQVVVPLLYLIYRSHDGPTAFGIVPVRWLRDLSVGLMGAVVSMLAAQFASGWAVSVFGRSAPGIGHYFHQVFDVRGLGWLLLVLAILANSLAEEIVVRSFLIRRFTQLSGSRWIAVVGSSALFASYHLYQGVSPAIGVFAIGLVMGVIYVREGRLAPVVLAHTFVNLLAALSSNRSAPHGAFPFPYWL